MTKLTTPLESAEQAVVIRWCLWHEGRWPELRFLFAVPNAAKRTKFERGLNLDLGMKAGVPDLILPVPRGTYVGLAMEMKRVRGRGPSDLQREWLDGLASMGWRTLAAYGANEAIDAITSYMSSDPAPSHQN